MNLKLLTRVLISPVTALCLISPAAHANAVFTNVLNDPIQGVNGGTVSGSFDVSSSPLALTDYFFRYDSSYDHIFFSLGGSSSSIQQDPNNSAYYDIFLSSSSNQTLDMVISGPLGFNTAPDPIVNLISFSFNDAGDFTDHTVIPSVPEPATIALFGIGMLGFAVSGRKRINLKRAVDRNQWGQNRLIC